MLKIEFGSRKPIYEQICEQTKFMISRGAIKPNEKMPSVRDLSVQLSVNPNTIQRAYSDLCNSGILYSVPGKGCFISDNAKEVILKNAENQLNDFNRYIKNLRILGIDKKVLIDRINEVYKTGGIN